jgi:hypothetical protein
VEKGRRHLVRVLHLIVATGTQPGLVAGRTLQDAAAVAKLAGFWVERTEAQNTNMNYAISDKPMSEEEWVKRYVTVAGTRSAHRRLCQLFNLQGVSAALANG